MTIFHKAVFFTMLFWSWVCFFPHMSNYRPQRSWGKVIFPEACVNNSVHKGGLAWFDLGGACVVLFGGGHAWFYLGEHAWFYSGGGMHGFIPGGHAWFYSGGGVHGFIGGCAWFHSGDGMRGFFSFFGYNEIRSMSGRYASYWNAFLFDCFFCFFHRCQLDISLSTKFG